jgi:hypothetical protein
MLGEHRAIGPFLGGQALVDIGRRIYEEVVGPAQVLLFSVFFPFLFFPVFFFEI